MADKYVKYGNVIESSRADGTLTYTKYVKDEKTGKSTQEQLDEKVNKSDELDASHIKDGAITEEKLDDRSVTNGKLSPSSVTYDKINDKAVITEKLNDRAVTTEKLEEKAITNPKLGDQAVDGRVLREASVETKHIANDSVTSEKLAEKSVTSTILADQSVDASKLVDGCVGNQALDAYAVTTEKIKDGSVTNDKIADGTLKMDKLDPELRRSIEAATGLPEDLTQMIQNVDVTLKSIKETDEKQQSQINENTKDIESLKGKSNQLEQSIKDITISGGASTANAVSYDNEASGLESVTAQGAIDELSQKKIDKEEGKSLIDDEIKDRFNIIENEEFIEVKVDAEDKVLEGITSDGKKQINLPTTVPSVAISGVAETTSMESEEFLDLKTDRENHILEGITRDGEKVLPLPIVGNPTINELKQEIDSIKESSGFLSDIGIDEETGDIYVIMGESSSEPETIATFANVDEQKETAIFNK